MKNGIVVFILLVLVLLSSCDIFLPDQGAFGQACTDGGLCLDGLVCDIEKNQCVKVVGLDGDADESDLESSDKEKYEAETDLSDSDQSVTDGDDDSVTTIDVACEYKTADQCAEYHWPENCADSPCVEYGWQHTCNKDTNKCENTGLDFGETEDISDNIKSFVGVWGSIIAVSTITSGMPVVGEQKSMTFYWNLIRLSRKFLPGSNEGDLVMDSKVCKMEFYDYEDPKLGGNSDPIAWQQYPEAYWKNLEKTYTPFFLNSNANAKDEKFFVAMDEETRGCVLEYENSKFPDEANDSQVWDQDKDEKPGMTMTMHGTVTGETYYVERHKCSFDGTVKKKDYISGNYACEIEIKQIGASKDVLYVETAKTAFNDNERDRSYFRMMKLDNDATCEELLKIVEEKDEWLSVTAELDDVSP